MKKLLKAYFQRLETELTVKFVQLSSDERCTVLHKHRSAIARRVGQLEAEFATLAAASERRDRLERFECAGTSLGPMLTSIWAKVISGRDYAAVAYRLRVPGLPAEFLEEAWPALEGALSTKLIASFAKASHDLTLAVNAAAPLDGKCQRSPTLPVPRRAAAC